MHTHPRWCYHSFVLHVTVNMTHFSEYLLKVGGYISCSSYRNCQGIIINVTQNTGATVDIEQMEFLTLVRY